MGLVEEREEGLANMLAGISPRCSAGEAERALQDARADPRAGDYGVGFAVINELLEAGETRYRVVVADADRAATIDAVVTDTAAEELRKQGEAPVGYVIDWLYRNEAGRIHRTQDDRYRRVVELHPITIPAPLR